MDMTSRLTLLALLLLVTGTVFVVFVYPYLRNRRLQSQPFPPQWLGMVRQQLPAYRFMSVDEQYQLQRLILRFVNDISFIGCGGQVVDDRVRISIAAHACTLLINRPEQFYEGLQAVLVYPSAFIADREVMHEDGVVSRDVDVMSGESWETGKVVLAWEDVLHSLQHPHDGFNVVLHEFAHQLDQASGAVNGCPVLDTGVSRQEWARTLTDAFTQLQVDTEAGRPTLLDGYGASEPAEFFAVSTECFYEQPWQLAAEHPALFERLHQFYRSDPRHWHPGHQKIH